jgi:alcohol dehydrogenase class IV
MNFEFATVDRILFGRGIINQVGKLAKTMGTKVLIASGMPDEETEKLIRYLREENLDASVFSVLSEPTVEGVEEQIKAAKSENFDIVIGFGGGSAIDTAKTIAAMLANSGELMDYLEVIGKGYEVKNQSVPFIAIPTTSGTGAEVARNSSLRSLDKKLKVSIRSLLMLARVVLVDPELTLTVPPQVTASTGLDALTQVMEPYVSNAANPVTDALCREGMVRAARSLHTAYCQGDNIEAREDMSIVSLFGGLALANAKLGTVHGFASVIGGMFDAPHGIICAALLPFTMETNVKALCERNPDSEAITRYEEIARILTGNLHASVGDGVSWLQGLCTQLNVPKLSEFGLSIDDIPSIVEKTLNASSTKGNPIVLTYEELKEILVKAM